MYYVELCWLHDEPSLKEGLQAFLGSSGQLLKRHLSSKEQKRAIRSGDVSRLPIDLVNHLGINPAYQGPPVRILRETDDVIVLHKPPGVHCHPLRYSDDNTLLNFLAREGKWEALRVNQAHYDRGLLYRLDEETSGVLVLAKTEKLYQEVRGSFSVQVKRKFYWAIVEGDFDKDGAYAHHFLATGVKGGKQKVSEQAHPGSEEGALAVGKVLSFGGKSLLLVKLKTGLRHQIRAQLSFLGHPILGDELYGGKQAERLFLHALRYEWRDTDEDFTPELFHLFFDLDGALEVTHDMFRVF